MWFLSMVGGIKRCRRLCDVHNKHNILYRCNGFMVVQYYMYLVLCHSDINTHTHTHTHTFI